VSNRASASRAHESLADRPGQQREAGPQQAFDTHQIGLDALDHAGEIGARQRAGGEEARQPRPRQADRQLQRDEGQRDRGNR